MRMSKLFGTTLREVPSEVEIASHQLLLRAGFIRQVSGGNVAYLPLGQRALTRVENLIRAEMVAIGSREVVLPLALFTGLRQVAGQRDGASAETDIIPQRQSSNLKWPVTPETAAAELARHEIQSYRQLPRLIYQIQTRFREDSRPRAGLIGMHEFILLASYSFDRSLADLDQQYQAHARAFSRVFERCDLPVRVVASDIGSLSGLEAKAYVYLTPAGEETLLFCHRCDYAAHRRVAAMGKPDPVREALLPLEKVATPGAATIAELAAYLNIPPEKTAKAVFLAAEMTDEAVPQMVFAVLRGDMALNETKLAHALAAAGKGDVRSLRPALEPEIRALGAIPGYASPIGIERDRVWVVVDDLISRSPNLVAGANEAGYHVRHTNLGRDYEADIVADIVQAEDGAPCPHCTGTLRASQGVEVGYLSKPGTRYATARGLTFINEDGQLQPIAMGSYGLDVSSLLACLAEEHHDKHGLTWPLSVAPYPVHLVALGSKDGSAEAAAEGFFHDLLDAGLEALYDDRDERAGVKFNDADLIGIPLRVTISARSLTGGGYEFKRRDQEARWIVPAGEALMAVRDAIRKTSPPHGSPLPDQQG